VWADAFRDTKNTRPELIWLQEKCERIKSRNNLRTMAELDELIYTRMYGTVPKVPSDTLKIRYWRTGHHVPANRQQCLEFARALELDEEETRKLLLNYYDRNDQIFTEEDQENSLEYSRRRELMDQLVEEYLFKVTPQARMLWKVPGSQIRQNIRHLYYMDALQYTGREMDEQSCQRHIESVNFGSEMTRILTLMREIPRRTMIRHLLILGMPYVSREVLDEWLIRFGYRPLCGEHTTTGGAHLDWLLLQLLDLYEEECAGRSPSYCTLWFKQASSILDRYFTSKKEKELRLMYFKALGE
jgi:hypothetical protein